MAISLLLEAAAIAATVDREGALLDFTRGGFGFENVRGGVSLGATTEAN